MELRDEIFFDFRFSSCAPVIPSRGSTGAASAAMGAPTRWARAKREAALPAAAVPPAAHAATPGRGCQQLAFFAEFPTPACSSAK